MTAQRYPAFSAGVLRGTITGDERMRVRPAVTALVCIAVGGYLASRLYAAHRTGPFELWGMRAGMPFATIDDREHEASKRRFVCLPLGDSGRLCQLHGRAMPGMLRIFVDADGRAAVIQFWPADDNTLVGDEARRFAAEWTRVRPPVSAQADGEAQWATTSRWRSMDNAWSATIQFSCRPQTPTVIEVADDVAIADAIARDPGASPRLIAAGLIAPVEEAQTSEAPRRTPDHCGPPNFTRPST